MVIFKNENVEVNYWPKDEDGESHIYITGQDSYTFEHTVKANEKFEAVNELTINELKQIVKALKKQGIDI